MPNGVAFREGDLFVAEVSRVLIFRDIEANLDNPPDPEVIFDDYPEDHHHGWKFIRFGPDGWLYVPVGAPCNICERSNPVYASITRLQPDGSHREIFASGVRNSVGFDWHPQTQDLYFTDNGRDWLGDDMPPDELNRATERGRHFGYPYCHGRAIRDPDFGEGQDCTRYESPILNFGAHVAALGLRFYTGTQFPASYQNQLFVAQHGSWNRSEKVGYRVMLVRFDQKGRPLAEPFAEGWLDQNGKVWGRPVDVEVMADGSLLVSDDHAGLIYRVTYPE